MPNFKIKSNHALKAGIGLQYKGKIHPRYLWSTPRLSSELFLFKLVAKVKPKIKINFFKLRA